MTDQKTATAEEGQHALTLCVECEARGDHPNNGWDTDPKLHYGFDQIEAETGRVLRRAPSYHHDCAPASVRRDVLGDGSVHSVAAEVTRAAFEGVDKGLRGGKLRAHIQDVHVKAAAAAEKE